MTVSVVMLLMLLLGTAPECTTRSACEEKRSADATCLLQDRSLQMKRIAKQGKQGDVSELSINPTHFKIFEKLFSTLIPHHIFISAGWHERHVPSTGQSVRILHKLWMQAMHGAMYMFVASFGMLTFIGLVPAIKCLMMLMLLVLPFGLVRYTLRLIECAWLRQEWCDWLRLLRWNLCGGPTTPCAICIEDLPSTRWHFATMPCCGKKLCWQCVRRHAETVVLEARAEMLCPFGHCLPLPDTFVHAAIRREQWSWRSFDMLGRTAEEKLCRYQIWVMACGLAENCSARMEDVVHCPTEDCKNMWVLPRVLRQRKASSEPQSKWNPRSWRMSRVVGIYSPATQHGQDLRHVHCSKCGRNFCLLCGEQWGGTHSDHTGKSCIEHRSANPKQCDADVRWTGAKACPGCGIHIIRNYGCNHMTCTKCRTEWCWVCRRTWSGRHYSCTPGRTVTPVPECTLQ